MTDQKPLISDQGRRRVLRLGSGFLAAGGLTLLGTPPVRAASPERALSFYHLHTGETLKVTYWAEGGHIPEALTEINHILRDFRTDEVSPIDVRLLDLLHRLREDLDTTKPYNIISGYRSPATNTKLARGSRGVASRSMHLVGKAIDVRLPGRPLRKLHRAAVAQKSGGVGFYPNSNFVHLDVGRVRYW